MTLVNQAKVLGNVKDLETKVRNLNHVTSEILDELYPKISETNDLIVRLLESDILTSSEKETTRLQERRLEKVAEMLLVKVRATIGR